VIAGDHHRDGRLWRLEAPVPAMILVALLVSLGFVNLPALRRAMRGDLPAVPVRSQDSRWSVISSAVDGQPKPNDRLIRILLAAGQAALDVDLAPLAQRCTRDDARYVETWPGEHYRLLAALVVMQQPSVVAEVGTFRGHGALALLAGSPDVRVVTYDVIPWDRIDGTALTVEDFAGGRLVQQIGDLVDPAYFETQLDTIRAADLVFVDGPKDGQWEQRFVDVVLPRLTDRSRLVVFDDIRLLAMVQVWRDLPYPKLDATSFGHWSGTGLMLTG
jgi:predicted O-methyltransferase YrrM